MYVEVRCNITQHTPYSCRALQIYWVGQHVAVFPTQRPVGWCCSLYKCPARSNVLLCRASRILAVCFGSASCWGVQWQGVCSPHDSRKPVLP